MWSLFHDQQSEVTHSYRARLLRTCCTCQSCRVLIEHLSAMRCAAASYYAAQQQPQQRAAATDDYDDEGTA
jgi:hypothetical protein